MTEYYSRLPLFPLKTVLFPGQILRLHVFEDRYHRLVQDCLASEGIFGVALIKRGEEVGNPAEPFGVGITSKIHNLLHLDDGSLEIVCSGKKRFQLQSTQHTRPYITCDAQLWPWSYNPERDENAAASLVGELELYQRTLEGFINGDPFEKRSLPRDTFNLACLAAVTLKIPDMEKQQLLETNSLSDLAKRCLMLLRRETLLMKQMATFPTGFDQQTQFVNLN